MLIRRCAFEKMGRFNPALPAAGFIEWLGRTKRTGLRYAMLDAIAAWPRIDLANSHLNAMRLEGPPHLCIYEMGPAGRRSVFEMIGGLMIHLLIRNISTCSCKFVKIDYLLLFCARSVLFTATAYR